MAVGDPEAFRPWSIVFPETITAGNLSRTRGGLTLRDWFAGQIATAIPMEALLRDVKTATSAEAKEGVRAMAELCYVLADALVAERQGSEEE